jgi:hypothetical protein
VGVESRFPCRLLLSEMARLAGVFHLCADRSSATFTNLPRKSSATAALLEMPGEQRRGRRGLADRRSLTLLAELCETAPDQHPGARRRFARRRCRLRRHRIRRATVTALAAAGARYT